MRLSSRDRPAEFLKLLGEIALAPASPTSLGSHLGLALAPLLQPTVEDHVHDLVAECTLEIPVLCRLGARDDDDQTSHRPPPRGPSPPV